MLEFWIPLPNEYFENVSTWAALQHPVMTVKPLQGNSLVY